MGPSGSKVLVTAGVLFTILSLMLWWLESRIQLSNREMIRSMEVNLLRNHQQLRQDFGRSHEKEVAEFALNLTTQASKTAAAIAARAELFEAYIKQLDEATRTVDSQTQQGPPSTVMAAKDSNGFFTDVPDVHWLRKKMIFSDTPICNPATNCAPLKPRMWYQDNFEPNFSCPFEMRIGSWGDGGKWICCLLYTSPSPRDQRGSRIPSSA